MYINTKPEPVIIDTLQLEAEARRLRAEFLAESFAALSHRIASYFAHRQTVKSEG
ncbi:MAG: RSP_7527 family protein [Roseinatronobacter sp.]